MNKCKIPECPNPARRSYCSFEHAIEANRRAARARYQPKYGRRETATDWALAQLAEAKRQTAVPVPEPEPEPELPVPMPGGTWVIQPVPFGVQAMRF